MARCINKNNSVIALMEAILTLADLKNEDPPMLSLNVAEWNQALVLYNNNVNQCNSVITINPTAKYLTYKDLYVYCDDIDAREDTYMYLLDAITQEIYQIRSMNEARERGQLLPENRPGTIQEMPRNIRRVAVPEGWDRPVSSSPTVAEDMPVRTGNATLGAAIAASATGTTRTNSIPYISF